MAKTKLVRELEKLLGVKIKENTIAGYSYNDWLSYFRSVPMSKLMGAQDFLLQNLPAEGYAAASRWIEVSQNPSKIDKIVQGRLRTQNVTNLKQLAKSGDREAFYEALIDQNVEKLESDEASAQEVARLTKNIDIFNDKLIEIRSRKLKEGSILKKTMELASRKPMPVRTPNKQPKTTKKKAPRKAQSKKTDKNAKSE